MRSAAGLGVCQALPILIKKDIKNAVFDVFSPCKLRKQPINRDFYVIFDVKIHKCNRLLVLLLFLLRPLLAPAQPYEANVRDIVKQWLNIENKLFADPDGTENILPAVNEFYKTVETFLSSDQYRLYRYNFAHPPAWNMFKHSPPEDLPALRTLPSHIQALRQALNRDNPEDAHLWAAEINDSIMYWLELDKEAEQQAFAGYIKLFLVFTLFVITSVTAFIVLGRVLGRSIRQEQESAGFSRLMVLAQEDERGRLSRELHDAVIPDLHYLLLNMGTLERTENQEKRAGYFREAAALHQGLIEKLRNICKTLIPPDFDIDGMTGAIRQHCHTFGKRNGIDCRLVIDDNFSADRLDREKQVQVYRIVQEALTNVEKHARAGEAIVILRNTGQGISVIISDDGTGFTLPKDTPLVPEHLGLRGIKERAAILNAELTIDSAPNEGTIIALAIPGNEAAS